MNKDFLLPKILATSVVRGSQQGDSQGGVYLIDFNNKKTVQRVDWNKSDIDFSGRGWDRGLRGIAFHKEEILIAASDELFVFDQDFNIKRSFTNPYFKHAHEIFKYQNFLFITSTGFDSILVFDLLSEQFINAAHLQYRNQNWRCSKFNPTKNKGPDFNNELHINNVYCNQNGLYISGLKTRALIHIDKNLTAQEYWQLPPGVHNARPFKQGVIFNDTQNNSFKVINPNRQTLSFKIPQYPQDNLTHVNLDDSRIARQGFARGLCWLSEKIIAIGSSPSTISLFNLEQRKKVGAVNLTMDIRNAIHGLAVWPYP